MGSSLRPPPHTEPEVDDEPEDEEEEEGGEEAGKDEELGGHEEEAEPPPDPPPMLDGPRPRPTARTALVYDERMEEHCNLWDRWGGGKMRGGPEGSGSLWGLNIGGLGPFGV